MNLELQQQLINTAVESACHAAGVTDDAIIAQLREEALVTEYDGQPVVSVRLEGTDSYMVSLRPGYNGPMPIGERLRYIVDDRPKATSKAEPAKQDTGDLGDLKLSEMSPSARMSYARTHGMGPKPVDPGARRKPTADQMKAVESMSPTERMKFARRHGLA